jgi:hypothetical protein
MENAQGLLTAAASLVALLALLRWIFGGARRRSGSRGPRARVRGPAATWTHVGTRRRDLASTGSWQIRIR